MSYQAWKHEPFYWAPTHKPGGSRILYKSSPAAPPAPDYAGAAQATAAGNLDAAKYATEANRVNQVTPWGSLTWNKSTTPEGKDNWTQTVGLTPELQAALDAQMKVQQNQSTLAQTMQGQVQNTMSTPFSAPDYASYVSSVPGVKTNFDRFDYAGTGGAKTDPGSFNFNGGPKADYAAFDASGLPGVKTNPAGNLTNVPGVQYFNPSQLQGAGGASAGNVTSDASAHLGGVPGINYDSRSYTNGAQPVNYDAPVFDQQSLQKYADATYKSSTRLLQDQWGQQNSNMDVQLRLQGLTPGTEAYNNAMGNALKSQDFTRAQLADTALVTGSQIANQDYGSMLAGYKARNDAQAQDFGQRLQNYGADLSAQNQGFGQGMAKANFAQTGQNMNAVNGINAAGVNVQAAQVNNQAMLGAHNANLAAQGQAFGQGLSTFQAGNAAQQQAFNQAAGVYGMNQTAQDKSNAAQQQAYGQALGAYGANLEGFNASNAGQQQNYNQALAQYGANQTSTQAYNAAQQQAYGQAQNNYSTAYQSALNNYTMPLNMMNAVMSGNQVQSPTFGGYYTQGQTAGPDMLGAAGALGQWQSGVMAQQQAAQSSTNGLLGTAAMAAATFF